MLSLTTMLWFHAGSARDMSRICRCRLDGGSELAIHRPSAGDTTADGHKCLCHHHLMHQRRVPWSMVILILVVTGADAFGLWSVMVMLVPGATGHWREAKIFS